MLEKNLSAREIEEQFVHVASALYDHFPDLDLRFNLRSGTTKARCLIPNAQRKALKFELGGKTTEELVREAVWAIKILMKRYDD